MFLALSKVSIRNTFYLGELGVLTVLTQCRLVNMIRDLKRVFATRCRMPGVAKGLTRPGPPVFDKTTLYDLRHRVEDKSYS